MARLKLSRIINIIAKTSQHHRVSSITMLASFKRTIRKKLIKTEIKIKTTYNL
jgi:hypothetical protein